MRQMRTTVRARDERVRSARGGKPPLVRRTQGEEEVGVRQPLATSSPALLASGQGLAKPSLLPKPLEIRVSRPKTRFEK